MYEKKIMWMYYRELAASIAVYILLLVPALRFGPQITTPALRVLAMTSPMIGFCLMVWAVARQLKRSDEFMRQTHLENFAIAAAITAGLSFTYGFLEGAGFPRLSMFVVWMVMGSSWGVIACLRNWMQR